MLYWRYKLGCNGAPIEITTLGQMLLMTSRDHDRSTSWPQCA